MISLLLFIDYESVGRRFDSCRARRKAPDYIRGFFFDEFADNLEKIRYKQRERTFNEMY